MKKWYTNNFKSSNYQIVDASFYLSPQRLFQLSCNKLPQWENLMLLPQLSYAGIWVHISAGMKQSKHSAAVSYVHISLRLICLFRCFLTGPEGHSSFMYCHMHDVELWTMTKIPEKLISPKLFKENTTEWVNRTLSNTKPLVSWLTSLNSKHRKWHFDCTTNIGVWCCKDRAKTNHGCKSGRPDRVFAEVSKKTSWTLLEVTRI